MKSKGKKSQEPNSADIREPEPFDPLKKRRLAESIVRELLMQPATMLPPKARFRGAGVYAIYYKGNNPIYARLTELNSKEWRHPIYIGKADPPGRRKGGFQEEASRESSLYPRLAQHAESLKQVSNLKLEHFRCRYLVVDDVWIGLAESLLIDQTKPVWNAVLDGFGIHDPGKGRHAGKRSFWDTLHPGRRFAIPLSPNPVPSEELEARVRGYLSTSPK